MSNPSNPSAGAQGGPQPSGPVQDAADAAVAALDDETRARLRALLMNKNEWRRETRRWET